MQEYDNSVTAKAQIVRRVLSLVDNQTVVAIATDHGHTDVGGHGGAEESVMHTPFIVYQRGSKIGKQLHMRERGEREGQREPQNEQEQLEAVVEGSNLDIAPTLCAILGLPVPRHNEVH